MRPSPIPPAAGQESVWDYPRPPRLEAVTERITVDLGGIRVADTVHAFRVLETSHPPVYYLPPADIDLTCVTPARTKGSFCEYKGAATYWTITAGDRTEVDAAWSYERPTAPFAALTAHLAFYCGRMDRCTVGDEVAQPQPGGFYGGWVTSKVVGPFKGSPGTMGW